MGIVSAAEKSLIRYSSGLVQFTDCSEGEYNGPIVSPREDFLVACCCVNGMFSICYLIHFNELP